MRLRNPSAALTTETGAWGKWIRHDQDEFSALSETSSQITMHHTTLPKAYINAV